MSPLVEKVVLACLFGVVSGAVDNFLALPDVDTKTGFFPDSGYLRNGQSQAGTSPDAGSLVDNPDSINNDNKLMSIPESVAVLPKRLLQIMSRMPEEKAKRLDHKKLSLPSPVEDSSYLHLFTGTKEDKKEKPILTKTDKKAL